MLIVNDREKGKVFPCKQWQEYLPKVSSRRISCLKYQKAETKRGTEH